MAAMNSERPHKSQLSPEKIISELETNAGKQFDPYLVLKLIDVIEKHGILDINTEKLSQARETIINRNPMLKNHA